MTPAAKPRHRITGFCHNKQCEGTKPVSISGKPMPICLHWQWCTCSCHSTVTKMYESVKMPRPEPIQNPDYRPDLGDFVMPMDDDMPPLVPLSNIGGTSPQPNDERAVATPQRDAHDPSSAPVPAPDQRTFDATPTGRKARGELEYEVLSVCRDFSQNIFDWDMCTPKLVSERIGKINSTEPPSTGAIVSVWQRWEKLEYAVWAKKPIRFISFREDPSIEVLLKVKDRAKRRRRRIRADLKRGVRSPQPQ